MIQRILSLIGLVPSLPPMGTSGASETLDADGQATVTYQPGKKSVLSPVELDETHKDLTDNDLVWPGKVDHIGFLNEEPMPYRFALTVTDLNPALYVVHPPVGGAWQSQGGVLLQPGEQTEFEIVFAAPPDDASRKPQPFNYVITRFDPRRSADPGEICYELPLKWVPMPSSGDLKVVANPTEIVTRPWRRAAAFALEFANRSELPPQVNLKVVRAETKEALEDRSEPAETVGALAQSLESRTSGVWRWLLPPFSKRASYYATVVGKARVGDKTDFPLTLSRPVHVRYLPWLRVWKDWAFLFFSLFFLMWLVVGIPIPKHPVAYVTLNFDGVAPGGFPPNGKADDLIVTAKPAAGKGDPVPGTFADGKYWRFDFGSRLCFNRWPFGWTGRSERIRFIVTAVPSDEKKTYYTDYDLSAPLWADETQKSHDIAMDVKDVKMLSAWTEYPTAYAPLSAGIRLNVYIDDLGVLKNKKDIKEIDLTATFNNSPTAVTNRPFPPVVSKDKPLAPNLAVYVGRDKGFVDIWATVGGMKSSHQSVEMTPGKEAQTAHLRFPSILIPDLSKVPTPVAGQPLKIPGLVIDPNAKVFVNDKRVEAAITPNDVTVPMPKANEVRAAISVQNPGQTHRQQVLVVSVKPPPQSHADLAYKAILDQDDATAQREAGLVGADEQALSLAVSGLLSYFSALPLPPGAQRDGIMADASGKFQQAANAPDSSPQQRGRALAATGQALIMVEKQKNADAPQQFQRAISLDKHCAIAYVYYAKFEAGTGHPDIARTVLQQALRDGYISKAEANTQTVRNALLANNIPVPK